MAVDVATGEVLFRFCASGVPFSSRSSSVHMRFLFCFCEVFCDDDNDMRGGSSRRYC